MEKPKIGDRIDVYNILNDGGYLLLDYTGCTAIETEERVYGPFLLVGDGLSLYYRDGSYGQEPECKKVGTLIIKSIK